MNTTKQIQVTDSNNEPFFNVNVWNQTQEKGTITDFDGLAVINGLPEDDIIVSHQMHPAKSFKFQTLPQSIKLSGGHELDEVTIYAPKKENNIWRKIFFGIAGIAVGIALASYEPQNVKL
jgi:hypothetical protein